MVLYKSPERGTASQKRGQKWGEIGSFKERNSMLGQCVRNEAMLKKGRGGQKRRKPP